MALYTRMSNRAIAIIALLLCFNIGLLYYKFRPKPVQSDPPPAATTPEGQSQPLPPEKDKKDGQPPPKMERVPEFVSVQTYRKSEDGTVYGDIMSHSRGAPFGDQHGRGTNAHETTHGINSEIRNANQRQGKKINGFYVLNGRGVVLEEPNIKMTNAVKFVPQNLRSYRWQLYMEKQIKDWNDTPTYICDEWVAYINGGACDVDDVKKGKHKGGWTDGVSGCCDFSIYTIALAMAAKADDPDYWKNYPQFRNFIIWEMRFAQKVFLEGRVMKEFKWDKQDQLLLQFLTSKEGEAMRNFCRDELEGVWIDIDPSGIKTTQYIGERKEGMDKTRPLIRHR
jgi:hypothetical protein